MDNDDNAYQGHGLHLASEESSKISPVLRPYALPKFDFDEGHLRFDSLVENEVFLGIPSQEDNQWIEDFSRGSSGIEFSSSAADSCSIPRHNVWSEATSSESVEMLLKSVGQEEIVAGESIVKESDAGDVLPCLTEPMDHNLRQDDIADEVKDHNSDLPPTEFLGSFTSLDQNPEAGSVQSNYASQSQEVDLSAYGYSSGIGEKGNIGTEENLHVELKFNEINVEEDSTAVVESLSNKNQEDSSISMVETGSAERTLPNSMIGASQLNVEDKISNVSQENIGYLQEELSKAGDHSVHGKIFAEDDGKSSKITAEDSVTNIHSVIHVDSGVEGIAKSASVTTNADILESPSLPVEGNTDLCSVEEHSSGLAQSNRSICVTGGTEHQLQSESENLLSGRSSASPQNAGDGSSSGPTMRVCNTDSCVFESQLNKEPVRGAYTDKKDDDLESCAKVCTDTTVVLTNASSAVQIEATEHGEHGHDNGGDNVFIPQESTPIGSVGAEITTGNSKPVDGATEIHNDSQETADHVLSAEPAVSSDSCVVLLSAEKDINDGSKNVPLQERDGRNYGSDLDNMPSETSASYDVGNKISFSSSGGIAEGSVGKTPDSPFDAADASNDKTEEVKSHETLDDVPSRPVGGATIDEVINQKEGWKPELSGAETLNSIDKDGTVAQVPIDASISRDTTMKQFSVPAVGKGGSEDCPAVVSENINQSVDLVKSSDKVIHAEKAVAEVSHERSEKTESASVESDPNLSKSGATNGTDLSKSKDAVAAKDHGLPSLSGGDISSTPDQSDPGSVSIVNATELSQSAAKKQCGRVEGLTANVPCSDGAEGVDNASSILMPVKGVIEEDRSFTFDVSPVAGLTEGETAKSWKTFSNNEVVKRSTLVEVPPSTSGGGLIDPSTPEVSHGSALKPDNRAVSGGPKVASERKTRRGSGRSAKENARKHVKETVPVKQTEKGDSSGAFYSPSGTGKLMPVELGNVERSGAKPSGVLSNSVSSLPDLNTSTPPSVLFHQPFTDMQQVQLRAQIFVYGSLIQGVAPDEACMASAFGLSDGGRSTWESAWRTCVERLHGQKPLASSAETPVQSRSGVKASDQANKQSSTQNKVRGSSKSTSSPAVSPMIPLSSPLWNVPTPACDTLPTNSMARGTVLDYQTLSPIHAYQTPTMRNFTGHATSWASQAPFSVPWVAPQSSPFDISAHFPALSAMETVKVTAVKESSVPTSSISKHTSTIPGVSGPNIPPAVLMHDTKKAAVSHSPHSVDPKSKKRKKASASEDLGQAVLPVSQIMPVPATIRNTPLASKGSAPDDLGPVPLLARNQGELASVSAASVQFSTSVAIASPSSSTFKSNSDKFVRVVSPISFNDLSKGVNQTVEKRVLLPEDIAKVAEAKLQAENAAAHASAAVTHCQSVWSELDKQKSSGLVSDLEAKLASAAIAIAAATSVAKAAAAAAKVASNAAMQAKQMADEALILTGTLNPVPNDPLPLPGFMPDMCGATPASILKAGDGNSGSSSIIVAAREASRRRMEAASAASRHAENLDAIVKAAELAADAVSQAGKIVALSEPLPLSKLVEAGPEGYWKVTEKPPGQDVKSNDVTGHTSNNTEEVPVVIEEQLRPSDKEVHTTDHDTSSFPRDSSKNSVGGHGSADEHIPASVCRSDKDLRGAKSRRMSDSSKTIGVVPESEIGLRSAEHENVVGTSNDDTITENCAVEVFKDNVDFGAWFPASVLNLKDGKAFVCYANLESDEGKLKEWIPLEAHGSKPPIIRLAHTSITVEGTRKRRRAAAKDKAWSIGDRVDVWMENCWREGVIVEKNNKDESAISVHFPVQGKISVVKVWHLRATRMWKNGDWIELPTAGQDYPSQGDTPQQKRVKMGSPAIEGKGKGKVASNVDISEAEKPDESLLLPLSAADKVFNIGNAKNDKQPETLRTMRSGLQKEGSKVIFGVPKPKPGKKRKFMEVSKHYTSDRSTKNNVSADSDKVAKYLMPQGSGARAWKHSSKIDPKEKQATESKPKAFKSGKPPSVSTRTLPRKENSLVSSVSAPRNADLTDNVAGNFTSDDDKNDLDEQNLGEFVSSSTFKEGAEPILSSSQAPISNVPKKLAAPNVKSERIKRMKVAPTSGKSSKVEEKEKSVPEVVEPRRSNRRIQPTSRLLEGLQSSLIITKIPSASHDKSHRNQNRGAPKGNN